MSGILDVGCGIRPRGTVNVDFFARGNNVQIGDQVKGEFMDPHRIPNFVLADACHLPFRDEVFSAVFSNHTIEHVPKPAQMFEEMCRVAKRSVIIRCPHRRGSGAKMPFHVNYIDETWFKTIADLMHLTHSEFVASYDYPISSKFARFTSEQFRNNIAWRALRHFERKYIIKLAQIPYEIECKVSKKALMPTMHELAITNQSAVKFVVVYNDRQILNRCFLSGANIHPDNVILHENTNHESLPRIFNKIIAEHMHEDTWFAFCHQDFVLIENLAERLRDLDTFAIYGPIGERFAEKHLYGMVTQTDGTPIGSVLKSPTPVQKLDEMCLIAHSSVFREGLRFDERFSFHLYGADLCMQAFLMGFAVCALQLACQHKSKTLTGDVTSKDFLSSLQLFREKWQEFL